MTTVRSGVTATIIGHLVCHLIGHTRWLPAGYRYRECVRCHHIQRIVRGDES